MSQSVALAMIVKDAAGTLGRCLQSVAEAVDEIVIVDTGSSDDTRAIARQFTDRCYQFDWCNDFAAARQFAFDRVKADWVMWLDADDRVQGAQCIRQTVIACSASVSSVHWKYITGRDSFGNSVCEFWRERCVRNDGTFHWQGTVHEVLVRSTGNLPVFNGDTVVIHERTAASRDPQRNLRILLAEYGSRQCGTHPRLLFYLAAEYADLGNYRAAIHFLERFLQVSRWSEQNYLAELKLAALLRASSRHDYALHAAHRALRRIPAWSLAHFSLAETYHQLGRWKQVIDWADRGRGRAAPTTVCIVNPMDWRFSWLIHYTTALYHCGRLAEALAWTREALQICPQDPQHLANLDSFESRASHAQASGDQGNG
jgi:glycosyltransferase involved in cell wall biosynthesis